MEVTAVLFVLVLASAGARIMGEDFTTMFIEYFESPSAAPPEVTLDATINEKSLDKDYDATLDEKPPIKDFEAIIGEKTFYREAPFGGSDIPEEQVYDDIDLNTGIKTETLESEKYEMADYDRNRQYQNKEGKEMDNAKNAKSDHEKKVQQKGNVTKAKVDETGKNKGRDHTASKAKKDENNKKRMHIHEHVLRIPKEKDQQEENKEQEIVKKSGTKSKSSEEFERSYSFKADCPSGRVRIGNECWIRKQRTRTTETKP